MTPSPLSAANYIRRAAAVAASERGCEVSLPWGSGESDALGRHEAMTATDVARSGMWQSRHPSDLFRQPLAQRCANHAELPPLHLPSARRCMYCVGGRISDPLTVDQLITGRWPLAEKPSIRLVSNYGR